MLTRQYFTDKNVSRTHLYLAIASEVQARIARRLVKLHNLRATTSPTDPRWEAIERGIGRESARLEKASVSVARWTPKQNQEVPDAQVQR
jgi:cytochrome c-type biogenesis protein CcmH/NrfG